MTPSHTLVVAIFFLAGGLPLPAGAEPALVDPTRPPGSAAAPAGAPLRTPAVAAPSAPAWPELRALRLSTSGDSSALLDGQVVRVGERLGEATLLAIDADGVLLRRGSTERRLNLLPGTARPGTPPPRPTGLVATLKATP